MKSLLRVSVWEPRCEMAQSEAGIEMKISHKQVLVPIRCGDWRLCSLNVPGGAPPLQGSLRVLAE